MAIVFACVRCDRKYSVSDAMAGRRATCKGCGQEQAIPSAKPALPASPAAPLTDFDEIDGPDAEADNPYARDFDDAPSRPASRGGGGSSARAKPARRPAARSALADLNLGNWVGGYLAINAVAFIVGGTLWYLEQVNPALIAYYLTWVVAVSGGALVLLGGLGLVVVGLNEGLSEAGRPAGLFAIGALGLGLPYLLYFHGNSLTRARGETDRSRQMAGLIREQAGLMSEMNDVLEKLEKSNDLPSAMESAPRMREIGSKSRDLSIRAQVLSNLTPDERQFVKITFDAEYRPIIKKVLATLRRMDQQPGVRGFVTAKLDRSERELAKVDEDPSKFDPQSFFGIGDGSDAALEDGVTVLVEGLDEEAKWKAFGERLSDAGKQQQPGPFSMSMTGSEKEMTFRIGPRRDAKDLADRMFFATIISVDGNVIRARPNFPAGDLDRVRAKLGEEKADREAKLNGGMAPRSGGTTVANAIPGRTKVDPNTIDGALETLKNTREFFKVVEAIKRLAWGIPASRKAEVVDALMPLLNERNGSFVKEALESLSTLKDPRSVPAMIALIDRRETMHDAIEALGKMKDARAAAAIADKLESGWPQAEQALMAIGPAAESAVIPKLRDGRAGIRRAACKVLAEIGGSDTLKVMKKLPADPDFGVQVAAREAMQAIAGRTGALPDPVRPPTRKGR